jgi:hypothetical protein
VSTGIFSRFFDTTRHNHSVLTLHSALGDDTVKDTTGPRRNENFQNFELKIEIFKFLKTQRDYR